MTIVILQAFSRFFLLFFKFYKRFVGLDFCKLINVVVTYVC
jgi:hypothetical protein